MYFENRRFMDDSVFRSSPGRHDALIDVSSFRYPFPSIRSRLGQCNYWDGVLDGHNGNRSLPLYDEYFYGYDADTWGDDEVVRR